MTNERAKHLISACGLNIESGLRNETLKCQVCGEEFDREHNWGYGGYAVCPLCARKMTERDWERLVEKCETCVACGEKIPEGRQVCKICEVNASG